MGSREETRGSPFSRARVYFAGIGHVRYVSPRREGSGSNTPSRGRVVAGCNFGASLESTPGKNRKVSSSHPFLFGHLTTRSLLLPPTVNFPPPLHPGFHSPTPLYTMRIPPPPSLLPPPIDFPPPLLQGSLPLAPYTPWESHPRSLLPPSIDIPPLSCTPGFLSLYISHWKPLCMSSTNVLKTTNNITTNLPVLKTRSTFSPVSAEASIYTHCLSSVISFLIRCVVTMPDWSILVTPSVDKK